jgi:two-component sensor histidine kinase
LWPSRTFSSPLRLLRVATVIGPLIMLAIAGTSLWQKQRDSAADDVHRGLELLVQHVTRLVETQELLLTYVDEFIDGMAWSEIANSKTVQQQLQQLATRSELTHSIMLLDSAGTLRATSRVFLVEPADLSDREYFKALRGGDQRMAFGGRFTSRALHEELITLARRKMGADGFDGAIAATVSAAKFQPFFESLRKDPRAVVTLARADGMVMFRSPDIGPATLPPTSGFMQQIAAADRGVYESPSALDGITRIFGFSRVGDFPLYVTYGIPTGTVMEAWIRDMVIAAAVAFAIAGAGVLLATQAIQRQQAEQRWRAALTSEVEMRTSELRESETRSKLLAAELDHRAKNMLALVQLLLRQTHADTVQAYARAAQGRVSALARAHALLSQSRWAGAELQQLVEEELAPYRRSGAARATFSGPGLLLEPRTAQALAMMLHELATNAAKYGALSVREGQVGVHWRIDPDGALRLTWSESGGPPVRPPTRSGLGTQVIQRSVRDQLDGAVSYNWRAEGLVCEIVVPARHLYAGNAARGTQGVSR